MPKPSRRARQKARKKPPTVPRATTPTPGTRIPRAQARREALSKVAETAVQPERRSFAEQYSYVRQDLQRIALLAGSIFAVLIILSFVLR